MTGRRLVWPALAAARPASPLRRGAAAAAGDRGSGSRSAPGLILIEGGFDYARRRPLSGLRPAGQPPAPADARPQLRPQLDRRAADRRRPLQPPRASRTAASVRRRSPACSTVTGDTTHDVEDIVVGHQDPDRRGSTWAPGVRPPLRDAAAQRQQRERPRPRHDRLPLRTAWSARPSQSVRFVGNVGLGILGDPTRGDNQNDVLRLRRVSVARAVKRRCRDRGRDQRPREHPRRHAAGRVPKPRDGAHRRPLHDRGTVRIDAGILFGMTSRDPSFGFTVGATYVFKGFTVP